MSPSGERAASLPVELGKVRRLGILGGTGAHGTGLGARLAAAGLPVVLGSRDAQRARAAAERVADLARRFNPAPPSVTGADLAECAAACDVVVVAVPWAAHAETLRAVAAELAGKVVVDSVNPVAFDTQGAFALHVAEGSALAQAAAILPGSRVVAAFHHLSAVLLADPGVASVECDVMVVGDDRQATDLVIALADLVPGLRGVYAGRLRVAAAVEALTANLISANRRYHGHAGLRLTGV